MSGIKLNLIKLPLIETPINPKHQRKNETFQEYKERRFKENYDNLFNLMARNKDRFIGIHIKKQADLLVTMWSGGHKLITLSNEEILYHTESQLIDFIKENLI